MGEPTLPKLLGGFAVLIATPFVLDALVPESWWGPIGMVFAYVVVWGFFIIAFGTLALGAWSAWRDRRRT